MERIEPPAGPPDDDYADAGRCCARCGSAALHRVCPDGDRVADYYAGAADSRYALRPSCITRDELADLAHAEVARLRARVAELEAMVRP